MVRSATLDPRRPTGMPRSAKAVDAAKELGDKGHAAAEKAKSKSPAKAIKERAVAKKAAPAAKKAAPAGTRKAAKAKPPTDKFLLEQQALLQEERATYEEQAAALKAQADQMAQEMEPGDIQFDDESGEGGTANIDRERDLALSAQARLAVDEIDHAMAKIANGTYGVCESCGEPIPKVRLKALPHARLCVACKSGGLSRR